MLRRRALRPAIVLAGCLVLAVALSSTAAAVPAARPERPPGVIHYVALGDSLTSAAYAGDDAYTVQYQQDIAADLHAVTVLTNLGIPGWTTTDLLRSVRNDEEFRDAIAQADVITVFTGAVDFFFAWGDHQTGECGGADGQDCLRSLVDTFRDNLARTIAELQSLNKKPRLVVRLAELYYPPIGDPIADPAHTMYLRYLQRMNRDVHAIAEAHGYGVARLYAAFHGETGWHGAFGAGLILPDAVHPTVLGFTTIAGAFRELGYAPLADDP